MNIRMIGVALAATVAAAGCASTAPGYGYGSAPAASRSAACYDCGTVTRIEMTSSTRSGVPRATGAVLGGVVGAVAGRELADDESTGRQNTATVVGAAAGAAAGHAIQNRVQSSGAYNVHVRMNDGRIVVVSQNDLGGIREGSYVRVYNGRAWAR